MSYFDFYTKSVARKEHKPNESKQKTESIKGTCLSMCPREEMDLRMKERMVHCLEVNQKGKVLVKSYSRSAADSNMAVPRLLRPYPVLIDTVEYLLIEVIKRSDISSQCVYDFINDRLRAVRQDMTIQRLPSRQCVVLLEPMIRFYVYYGYKLSQSKKDYDPVLNKKYLLECMKWFLTCCDTIDKEKTNHKLDELSVAINTLTINKKQLVCDRVLVESLYILCNLDDMHPLFRYLNLPKDLQSEHILKVSYHIAISNMKGNFIQINKLIMELCPLTYYAMCLYLPVLQSRIIKVLCHAYNSKVLKIPCHVLQEWLHCGCTANVRAICEHYGLKVEEGAVRFQKELLRADVGYPCIDQFAPHMFKVCNKKVTTEDIFIYTISQIH